MVAIMAIDTAIHAERDAGSTSMATPSLRTPTVLDAICGLGTIYGPSAGLNLFVSASISTLVRQALGIRPSCAVERRFRLVAGFGVGMLAAYLLAVRPWLRHWGATDDERERTLPGDDLVPDPAINSTWAVTIDAPAEEVWPWLAQIGQDRGGFYSYAWLENLAGCELRNADRIHPEWQQRAVGEIVPLHPTFGLPLAQFEPGRALVLDGWGPFVVEPIDDHRTRLISRSRVPKGWAALSYALLLEIPHFVMQRKMLLGIKERAERARRAHEVGEAPPPTPETWRARTSVPTRSGRLTIGMAPDPADTDVEMTEPVSTG
jgi:hypothetical protein